MSANCGVFLKQRALPNVLVNFFKLSLSLEQEKNVLQKIRSAIEKLYGKDRYVIYSIDENEFYMDSKTSSAAALLIIYDRNKYADTTLNNLIEKASIPRLTFDFHQLCSDDISNFDFKYFSDKIKDHLWDNDESSHCSLSEEYEDSTYLFDSVRTFQNWSTIKIDNFPNMIEYSGDLIQNGSKNLFFVDWNKMSSYFHSNNFNARNYYNNLNTKFIGKSLLFANKTSSTMDLINNFKNINGMVSVANYQTSGIGRNNNQWLSPVGCAMFSLSLNFSMSAPVMKRISFIQHLASLSLILALPAQKMKLKIKWPNDILYTESMSKLAGILVRSFCIGNMINIQIGYGVNVSNRRPSICLDEIIEYYNQEQGLTDNKLELIPKEAFIARILNNLEKLLDMLANNKMEEIKKLYCDSWIHSDQLINVRDNSDKTQTQARICGIDDYGYLLASDLVTGKILTLQPDGNRFDLMHHLVVLNVNHK